MDKKTSPLKAKPLRLAGQSLQEEIDRINNENLLNYILFPVFFIALAIYEWIKFQTQVPPSPIPITVLAVVATIFSTFKIIKIRKKVKNMRLGLDGET